MKECVNLSAATNSIVHIFGLSYLRGISDWYRSHHRGQFRHHRVFDRTEGGTTTAERWEGTGRIFALLRGRAWRLEGGRAHRTECRGSMRYRWTSIIRQGGRTQPEKWIGGRRAIVVETRESGRTRWRGDRLGRRRPSTAKWSLARQPWRRRGAARQRRRRLRELDLWAQAGERSRWVRLQCSSRGWTMPGRKLCRRHCVSRRQTWWSLSKADRRCRRPRLAHWRWRLRRAFRQQGWAYPQQRRRWRALRSRWGWRPLWWWRSWPWQCRPTVLFRGRPKVWRRYWL